MDLLTRVAADHDKGLVLLASLVCFLACSVSVSLLRRAQACVGRERLLWLGLSAAASGYGIWASNFIVILTFGQTLGATYGLPAATLSFLFAIAFLGGGILVAGRDLRPWNVVTGGILVGLGVAGMHIMAMLALQLPGDVTWQPLLFAAAVALGFVVDGIGFFIAIRRNDWIHMLTAAVLATVGVLCTHFMITASIGFVPDAQFAHDETISAGSLSLLLAGLAILISAMCLVAGLGDNKAKEKLRRQKDLMESALENIAQGLCMYDADGRILMFNERYTKMTGMPAQKLAGSSLLEVLKDRKRAGDFSEDPDAYFSQLVDNIRQGKHSSRILDVTHGRKLRVVDHPVRGGGWVATLEDITDWQEVQAKITHMALHDALTDLPNRRLFRQQLEEALFRNKGEEQVAVFCLDLDHFKEVNDSLGHPVGDELLREVAQRLLSSVRKEDMVARLGGDEFAVVQTGIELDASEASALAARLTEILSAPYTIHDQEIIISVSVGITMAPNDGTNPDQLLQNADIALYRSKADGRGTYRFFEIGMDAQSQARRLMLIDLRAALARGEFEVFYQPIHDLKGNRIICFEALARWRHPKRGMIAPADFIPVAEESGLIVSIGEWVLRQACLDAAQWPSNVSVAVNLSPVQFKNRNLGASVGSALADSGLPAGRLELEITETVLLQDTDSTLAALHQLRRMGVKIAMDDFGTGYSSLSYLQSFPFDKIKIDQSFIRRLGSHDDAMAIVRAVAGLGKSLGIRTTAEGVETREQLSLLRSEGCLEVQGYLFDKPRPAADVETMLNQQLRIVS